MNQSISQERKCVNCRWGALVHETSSVVDCHLSPVTNRYSMDHWCSHFKITEAAEMDSLNKVFEMFAAKRQVEPTPAVYVTYEKPPVRPWWKFWA
jgi:hypothetical protein